MTHARPRLRRLIGGVGATGVAVALALALSPTAANAAAEGDILGADRPNRIAGSYLVVLKDTATLRSRGVPDVARELAARHGGKVSTLYKWALRGFAVKMAEPAARRLAADPAVRWVETDGKVSITDTQSPTPSWGLDRIDQRDLPLNNSYTYPTTASTVTSYIIDTGVRITHTDFGGRASWGTNTTGDANDTDCNGHGTHVAGTTGGGSYGVAKGVRLVAVKVLGCSGSGTFEGVAAGVDWVTGNHTTGLATANMSLGGSGSNATVETAVANSIADGVTYALAAGNSNSDACNFTPARVPQAITLGASDSADVRASFSNWGTCLDLFAPGVSITSAYNTSDTATSVLSGTSMASPHAAGAASLILALNPTFTPQLVRDSMVTNGTPNKIASPGTGSPNVLLFVGGGSPPPPPTVVWADDFEANLGWIRNPNGTDTATTGFWSRGTPQATSWNGVVTQRGDTTSGVNGLFTDPAAGTGPGDFDVDSGVTSIQSPAIALPSGVTLTLSFNQYLAHLNNSGSDDFLRVYVVNSAGTSTLVFQKLGAAVDVGAAWAGASANISGFGGQTVRLRIEAADAGIASLVEAGVDDVRITRA
jgi:subtilisin family serine protease